MLLSVDPGLTTGWMTLDEDRFAQHGQDDFPTFVQRAYSLTYSYPACIIVERYTITAETLKKSRQHTALEVIGYLKGIAGLRYIPVLFQSPSDAKRLATDERLKEIGWWTPGADHANDAARHMFLYKVQCGHITLENGVAQYAS